MVPELARHLGVLASWNSEKGEDFPDCSTYVLCFDPWTFHTVLSFCILGVLSSLTDRRNLLLLVETPKSCSALTVRTDVE
jgi:hypothetical protein